MALCLSLVLLSPLQQHLVPPPASSAVFRAPVDGVSMWLGFLLHTVLAVRSSSVGALFFLAPRTVEVSNLEFPAAP